MTIKRAALATPAKSIPLSQVPAGDTFRFAHDSEVDIVEDGLLWMKVEAPEILVSRARIINLKDGKQLDRDADRLVVLVTCQIVVEPYQP